jgi:AraC-like DNA-binding protein
MPETRQTAPAGPAVSRRLAAGERIREHHHDRAQLVYPASGLLAVTTRRGTWIAPPQRAAWIPAGTRHQHRSYGITDIRTLLFTEPAPANFTAHPVVIAVSPLLRELILVLAGPAQPPGPAGRRLEQVALDQLAESPEQPLHLPEPADQRLRAATALLTADPASNATLAVIGRRVGASERTLSRLFHAEFGMSFPRWRTQLRIHHALVSLARGATVTSTAITCGWANPASFIEVFRHAVGVTPGKYQAQLKAAVPVMTEAGNGDLTNAKAQLGSGQGMAPGL